MDARRKTGEYAAWVLAALCLIAGGVLEGLGHAFALAWGLGGAAVLLAVLALLRGRGRRAAQEQADALRAQLEAQKTEAAQALEQAERAHREEMESFRGDLSHALRMPISIIQGYAELLADGVVEDEATRKEYLQKILQRTQDMGDALTRQLSEARTEGEIVPSPVRVDLLELARQAAADLETTALRQGIHIQVVSAEDAVWLEADPQLLTRVFFNLMENALKYMGRAGFITIRVGRDGDRVRVLVQDDGLGLDPGETRRIFERSFQGSNRAGGHGYGLYITRKIILAHGGDISASSAPGRGMGIAFTLPAVPAGQPVPAP